MCGGAEERRVLLVVPDVLSDRSMCLIARGPDRRKLTERRTRRAQFGAGFVTLLLIGLSSGAGRAADLADQSSVAGAGPASSATSAPEWIVTVGVENRLLPLWPGSMGSHFSFLGNSLPLFDIRRAGTAPTFVGSRDGIGYSLFDFGQLKLGPVARLISPRKASAEPALNGLGDIGAAVQAGGFAEYWPAPWLRLRGEARQGFGSEKGVTGDIFLDAVVPVQQFRLSAGPRVTFQSAAAVSPYFSITTAQAAASTVSGLTQLPTYNARGGLYSYGAGGKVEYFVNSHWATHGLIEYERLAGSAANSPLVLQRGSTNQLTVGIGITYSFAMRSLW